MASNVPIFLFPPIFFALLVVGSASPPPSPTSNPASRNCSREVVAFSPCLSFVASPPNNVSVSPSSQCCDVLSSAFDGGDADCLCYLVRRTLLLGFPLNSTRLLSLSSLCPISDGSKANSSLESLCSGLSALPPLQSNIGFNNTPPSMSSQHPDPDDASPATSPSLSTTIQSSSHIPAIFSSAANNCGGWFRLGTIIFLVPIFTNLYYHTCH